jgi:hypothetical protein
VEGATPSWLAAHGSTEAVAVTVAVAVAGGVHWRTIFVSIDAGGALQR